MLQKELMNLNKEIKIKGESIVLREKRRILEDAFKSNFPELCDEKGIVVKLSDIKFIMQGSIKLRTTITSTDNQTDLDLGVAFPLNIDLIPDSREIKKIGKSALILEGKRQPEIKEPCITVNYIQKGEEWLHVDLPMYAEMNGELYLARGKENGNYEWEKADPKGLNSYILERLGEDEDGQLRRLIRYMKKWKQVVYSNADSSNAKPPSIGLTLFAVDLYRKDDSDLVALYNLLSAIKNEFNINRDTDGSVIEAHINKNLPVQPFTNVFSKFSNSTKHAIKFYDKLSKAIDNLYNALNCDNEHDAGVYVSKLFGEVFEIPEKEVNSYATQPKKEHSFG